MTTIKRTKHCLSFVLFIVVIVLSVLRPFYCGHFIVCPSSFLLWSLHCLSFVLFIVVIEKDEGQTIPSPQWKGRRTDNTMTTIKRTKNRQYNDHNKVCPLSFSLWSWYCLSFVLFIVVIALSVLRPFHCGHCIFYPSSFLLWSLYCRTKDRQCNDHNKKDEGQTIPWPQWKGQRTHNTMTTIKRTKDRQCIDHNKKDEGQTIPSPF
jgi:hypothetical protein